MRYQNQRPAQPFNTFLVGRESSRKAYTLLEVLLASTIGLLIMLGLYAAIRMQLRFAEAGRNTVNQAALARSLFKRIANDVAPSVGLPDPGRYRNSRSQGQSSGGTQPATPGATDGNTTEETMEDPPSGGSVLAVIGTANKLVMYVSRVPRELSVDSMNPDGPPIVSDQRQIIYELVNLGDVGGLARYEIPLVTNVDTSQGAPEPVIPDPAQYILAPEVVNLEFFYWDGAAWQTSWDGRTFGPDGKTPQGPPLAIAVLLQLETPGLDGAEPQRNSFRHVIHIPTANGLPQAPPTEQPTTQP